MLLLAMCLKLVAEVALMALVGQWLLGLWVGPSCTSNAFWRLLDWIGLPPRWLVAQVARLGGSALSPAATRRWSLLLLLSLWLSATAGKVAACLQAGVNICR